MQIIIYFQNVHSSQNEWSPVREVLAGASLCMNFKSFIKAIKKKDKKIVFIPNVSKMMQEQRSMFCGPQDDIADILKSIEPKPNVIIRAIWMCPDKLVNATMSALQSDVYPWDIFLMSLPFWKSPLVERVHCGVNVLPWGDMSGTMAFLKKIYADEIMYLYHGYLRHNRKTWTDINFVHHDGDELTYELITWDILMHKVKDARKWALKWIKKIPDEITRDEYTQQLLRYMRVPCDTCGVVDKSLLKCGSCQAVWYCSQSCQKSDWKDHKPACQILKC